MSSLPLLFPNLVPGPPAQLPLFQRDSPEMIRLLDQVHRVAPQNTTVLLSGETGTGKSRLARLIHDLSPRRSEPFLVVNCGALAAGLIESELFGHVRGAFTGAVGARDGRLAEVGSGTLMLDDIDGLPRPCKSSCCEPLRSAFSRPLARTDRIRCGPDLLVR